MELLCIYLGIEFIEDVGAKMALNSDDICSLFTNYQYLSYFHEMILTNSSYWNHNCHVANTLLL